jgi:BASS family bile acid:Na+ symporter
MKKIFQFSLLLSAFAAIVFFKTMLFSELTIAKLAAILMVVFFTIGMGALDALKRYRYTACIIVAVMAGMLYPQFFLKIGNLDLRNKWLILIVIQVVMFGMGIQMKLKDFTGIASTGKGVTIGLICHFSIMPLMGFLLTKLFHFEPEIAAGIILIGSCSSGLASNVMVYIARANLVLSVVVTAMATLAAPFLTPLLMKLLAGTLIEVKFVNMMLEIIKIVLVPIGAALLNDYLKTMQASNWRGMMAFFFIAFIWLMALFFGVWNYLALTISSIPLLQSIEIASFLIGAYVVGVLYHLMSIRFKKLDQIMPYLSMAGIIYFTTVTTAAGRDNLLQVGLLLFLASVIHNAAGYFFGYWLSRLFKLDIPSARTIAFEVGLQNGGMASGLAGTMGKLGTVGLPAAVFSPWMNISGSILANYWRKKTIDPLAEKNTASV